MSGRTRHLRDGLWITNRKTDRRNPRTPAGEPPILRLIFQFPPAGLIRASEVDTVLGAECEVGPLANACVSLKTFNKDRLFAAAAQFLRKYTPRGLPPFTVTCVLHSSSDPNWSDKWSLTYIDGHVTASRTSISPLMFPAAA